MALVAAFAGTFAHGLVNADICRGPPTSQYLPLAPAPRPELGNLGSLRQSHQAKWNMFSRQTAQVYAIGAGCIGYTMDRRQRRTLIEVKNGLGLECD
jgi:hypothetical protein